MEKGRAGHDAQHGYGHGHRRTAGFWVSAAVGWAFIGVGLRGILSHPIDTRPGSLARFVVGGALLHDLLVAPLVILFAVVLSKLVPAVARPVVQSGLLVTAALALFSFPLVRAYGLATHNPTSVPYNYGRNLAVVLVMVWAVAAVAIVVRVRRSREPDSASP